LYRRAGDRAVATGFRSKAQTEQGMKVDLETKNFVKNARIGVAFEVESSKLALEKSQESARRRYARQPTRGTAG
jgi:predicted outer membrane protein